MITDAPLAPSFLCCNIIVANKKVTSENYFPIIIKKVPEFSNIYSCGAPAPRLVIIPPPPPSENLRNIGICSLFGSLTEKVCITKARWFSYDVYNRNLLPMRLNNIGMAAEKYSESRISFDLFILRWPWIRIFWHAFTLPIQHEELEKNNDLIFCK